MKLLIVLICLASERFLIHSTSMHRFFWFKSYAESIKQTLNSKAWFSHLWIALIFITAPIVLFTGLIYLLLGHLFLGLVGFFLSLGLFFYSLGPNNIFYPLSQERVGITSTEELASYYLADANQQLFAVLFWYLIAGPIAALAYRVLVLAQSIDTVQSKATIVVNILEWVPARITALSFLLVGNFQQALKSFTGLFFSLPEANNLLLRKCGLQALRTNDTDEISVSTAEYMVERAILVWLVFIAVGTLTAWL